MPLPDIDHLVQPDRVHRSVYNDQALFDLEMEHIFETIWVYCGHESQVPKAGDYHTLQIGRQPMVMVRDKEGAVHVLYNRCPHRGVQLCGNQSGNTGHGFVCSYHAWSFHLNGQIRAIPLMNAYDGTTLSADNPDCSMKRAARVDSYRGFVFASLSPTGPSLSEFLGEAKVAFDDMCDRSPVGEVEAVRVCHRVMQHSNWKFFMENQLDALHPSVTHQSTGVPARRVEQRVKGEKGSAPLFFHYLSTFASSFEQWDQVQTVNFPHGHGILKAYMGLRPTDPDTVEYEALLKKAYGDDKAEEYLSRSIHHVLVYPYLSVQSPLQQLRCLRPIAPDKTLSEIWHFRLKGAPEAIYRRSLWYFNLVNSPATMINADDLENWTKGQKGLESKGGEWVSFHRHFGTDTEKDGVLYSTKGTSEVVMRNQFRAWREYMAPALAGAQTGHASPTDASRPGETATATAATTPTGA
jgi:phenylpropionate dioxygenase-like ring-hydroxylating dioxygenase large terminal subunit